METGVKEKPAIQPEAKPGKTDDSLYIRLRDLRNEMAEKKGVPPYVIFADKSLREMAAVRPGNREGFAAISGVGPFKLVKYGPVFIEEILKSVIGEKF
jgi:ATP-dependent DNA helicase RecQ